MNNKLSQPRETGSEKANSLCSTCGCQVPLLTSAYGSTAPGLCPSCWPEQSSAPTQLQAQNAAADAADSDR